MLHSVHNLRTSGVRLMASAVGDLGYQRVHACFDVG
jgi:hypothetical protein